MGRFDSTAAAYAAYREPYPAEFFAAAAAELGLTGREALLDVGAGPGLLALGFAPYVARIAGVDPEPAMVAEAQKAASAAGLDFPIRLGRVEDAAAELGRFDLITIGRALHWLDRLPTLAAFARLLADGGRVFVCASRGGRDSPWRAAQDQVIARYSEGGERENHRAHGHFFDATDFTAVGEVAVQVPHRVDAETLIARALTRSTTSPAFLGDRLEAFQDALRAALAPFFADGPQQEIIEARGRIFAASGGRAA